ncbi:hypothetical protein F5B19DRAFT_458437 [Rostrohypoxylon terebratum]|nr:hypothetical protein F5B19DRAFT_458437 [Rostrohypoxylon terebratum]
MNSLLSELLIEIFSLIKSSFGGTSDILSCLLVCRRWRELGVPVLYRHLVLGTANVELFAARFNSQYAIHVRSITLRLTQPPLSSYDLSSIIASNAELEKRLIRLEPLLGSLDMLLSFSLYVPAIVPERCRFKIPARSIIGLIKSLPPSCVNIEIDSGGYDRNIIAGGEEAHICESLHLLLPRMNHIRIHLSLVCPTLIGTMATPYNYHLDSYIPTKLPNIRSLLINCSEKSPSAGICLPPKTGHAPFYSHSMHPWPAMTSALQKLVDTPGCCPASATIRIHTTTGNDMAGLGVHDTMIICDINSHTTRALPIVKVSPMKKLGWLVRLNDSEGVLTTSRGLIDVAENYSWKTLIGGARVPAPMAEKESQGILEVPMIEEVIWRAKNPDVSCALWDSEALAGRRLLYADIRKEGVTYTNPVPVAEETS